MMDKARLKTNKNKRRNIWRVAIAAASILLVALLLICINMESIVVRNEVDSVEEISEDPGTDAKRTEQSRQIPQDLDAVFASFEGNWFFDRSRGAVIYVGRCDSNGWSQPLEGFPDGTPEWILSVTGGEVLTDNQVVSWTPDSILFCLKDGYWSKLIRTESGGIEYRYGTSPDKLDEVITSNDWTIAD